MIRVLYLNLLILILASCKDSNEQARDEDADSKGSKSKDLESYSLRDYVGDWSLSETKPVDPSDMAQGRDVLSISLSSASMKQGVFSLSPSAAGEGIRSIDGRIFQQDEKIVALKHMLISPPSADYQLLFKLEGDTIRVDWNNYVKDEIFRTQIFRRKSTTNAQQDGESDS
jgi:hypothetical protein